MSKKSIILSSSGIKNILEDGKEFTFIFGEQEIRMRNINSEFISPIVSHLHHIDPTIDRFNFTTKANDYQLHKKELLSEDIIDCLKEISKGNQIDLNDEQIKKMLIISIFVGNEELFKKMNELHPIETFDINELFEIIEIHETTQSQFSIEIEPIYDSLSNQFHEINKEKLFSLPMKQLYRIISNKHLKIENEDWLFEFIEELFENKRKDEEKEKDKKKEKEKDEDEDE